MAIDKKKLLESSLAKLKSLVAQPRVSPIAGRTKSGSEIAYKNTMNNARDSINRLGSTLRSTRQVSNAGKYIAGIPRDIRAFGREQAPVSPTTAVGLQLGERFATGAGNRALEYSENFLNSSAGLGSKLTGDNVPTIQLPRLNSVVPDTKASRFSEGAGSFAFDLTKDVATGKVLAGSGLLKPLQGGASKVIGKLPTGTRLGKIASLGLNNIDEGLPYTVGAALTGAIEGDKDAALRGVGLDLGIDLATGVIPYIGKTLTKDVVDKLFTSAKPATKDILTNSKIIGRVGDIVGIETKDGRKLAYDTVANRITKTPLVEKTTTRKIDFFNQGKEVAPLHIKEKGMEPAFGALAGTEFERDENGNITGVRIDPLKATAGIGLMAGITKARGGKLGDLSDLADAIKDAEGGRRIFRGGAPIDINKFGKYGTSFTTERGVAETFKGSLSARGSKGVVEERILSPDAKVLDGASLPKELLNEFGFNPKYEVSDGFLNKVAEYAKDNGYDGVDLSSFGKKTAFGKLDEAEIRILNPKVLRDAVKSDIDEFQQVIDGSKVLSADDFATAKKVVNEGGALAKEVVEDVKKTTKVLDTKVNILDYLRTPDRVLKKIGLGEEAELVKRKYNDYLDDLPKEIGKITDWWNQVDRSPESSKAIFRYLDGSQSKESLTPLELNIAGEIQTYLADWADKLQLPKDKRITNYITHIFEQDFIQKEFDPDLAKILADKVPGSVYDPFLEARLGKQGYIEDVFRALDAYTKRATRKFHMDQALEPLKKSSEGLPLESWKYVKNYTDRINMRPTDVDNLIDNLIKQSPVGYKFGQRPTTNITRKIRNAVYRGTLGLNVSSAIRNLTQGANTYAELGEKYTGVGYVKMVQDMISGGDELVESGVLRDNIIQDRTISATRKGVERLDKTLFSLFDFAERINRGSAYFGAKARAIANGKSEKEAIEEALDVVRKTQFTFGSVDTPVALQSDLAKFITQFQSFNVKQTEFLAEKIQDKDFIGLIRWLGATVFLVNGVSKALGINMDVKGQIPFSDVFTGESRIGQTPPIQLAKGVSKAIAKTPDDFGNVPEGNVFQRIATNKDVQNSATAFVPAGVQLKKSITGMRDGLRGYNTSASGRVRFPVSGSTENKIKGVLFGPYSVDEAREYFDNDLSPLSEKQTERFKSGGGADYYKQVMNKRTKDKLLKEAKETGDTESLRKVGALEASTVVLPTKQEQFSRVYTDVQKSLAKAERDLADLPYENMDTFDMTEKEAKLVAEVEHNRTLLDRMQKENPEMTKEAEYFELTKQTNAVRSVLVKETISEFQESERPEMLQTLANLRKLVDGRMVLSDEVINGLQKEELITKNEAKLLKDFKIREDGTAVTKVSGRGRSAKLKKIKFVPINAVGGKVKLSTSSASKLKLSKIPSLSAPDLGVKSIDLPKIKLKASELPKFKVKFNL